MRPLFSLIFILLLASSGWAHPTDSLINPTIRRMQKLELQPASRNRDTTTAVLLDSCARFWIGRGQPTKALEALRRYEAISAHYEWPYGEALLLYRKGHYEVLLGNSTKAKAYFLEAIPRLKRIGQVHIMLLAYVQMSTSDIDRDWSDTTGIRTVIRYLQEGVAISLKTPNRQSYSALTFRIGRAYMQLQNYTEALYYLNESWHESQRKGPVKMPFFNCLHYAVCYTHLNDENRRQPVWEQCQQFLPTLNVRENYAYYWFSADMHRYKKKYALMVADAQQLVHYARLLQSPTKRLQAHRILFDAYKQLNKPALALAELETVKQLEDSTLQQRSNVKLAELQLKFDVKQKQVEVDRLTIDNQQSQTRLLVGGMLMLILLMGLIAYNNRQLRQKNRAISVAHLQGQALERQRVAADLHDNLGTTLAALQWSLDATDKSKMTAAERAVYATIREQVSLAYRDVRLLSHNLLPTELAKQGLVVALQRLVDKMNRNTAVRFTLIGAEQLSSLDEQTEFELYSICLELLNNVIKHAQATEATIDLRLTAGTLLMTVHDNGKGGATQTASGRGLQNIADRVASLTGTLFSERGPGGGMHHQIRVPVRLPVRASSQI
ncbi:hypothetical protein JYG30_09565 [Fibrella sp. USSR17]